MWPIDDRITQFRNSMTDVGRCGQSRTSSLPANDDGVGVVDDGVVSLAENTKRTSLSYIDSVRRSYDRRLIGTNEDETQLREMADTLPRVRDTAFVRGEADGNTGNDDVDGGSRRRVSPVASNTEASNTDINEPVASNTEGKNPYVIETNTTDIETTGTNATGTDIDTEISEPKINDNTKNGSLSGTFSQEVSLAKESPLTEVTLTEPDNEFIHVKNPNEVYYERYQKVRNEAKKLRKQALEAFLEAENLKINHCIEDTDEEEEF